MSDCPHAPGPKESWFYRLAPGILIAATGVGAGDLITASLAGSKVGVALVWAVVVGAIFKWVLNEGLARWQMATGTTLLEGWVERLGHGIQWVFVVYLVAWAFFTGGALITACGVAGAGICDLGRPLSEAKVYWGVAHALVGLALVWMGGFRLFEKIMSVCIGVMFCAVMATALMVGPNWGALGRGLWPSMPADSLIWTLGLMGGVGGSVTLMSYGYWIREQRRSGLAGVRQCRLDLAVGYTMTALFGAALLSIGSRLSLDKGDAVAIELADQLAGVMGPAGKWIFLIGFWGAVFSSLLGVWQSIPYLFADFVLIRKGVSAEARREIDYTRTRGYRGFLLALAIVPMAVLGRRLETVQLAYAVMASLFMPLLAVTLLVMNTRAAWVGQRYRSGRLINVLLIATVGFFLFAAWYKFLRPMM